MAERTGYWVGAPNRWAEAPGDEPDPTSGRHAFDQEAALTPIFTTMRRSARPSHLRPLPGPADRFHSDPPTTEFPVVRPLSVAPLSVAPPPTAPVPTLPAPSPSEMTTWWSPGHDGVMPEADGYPPVYDPTYDVPGRYDPEPRDRAAYDAPRYDPAGYDSAEYGPAGYDPTRLAPYDRGHDAGYDAGYDPGYDATGYIPTGYVPAPYESAEQARDESGSYGIVPQGRPTVTPFARSPRDAYRYDPLTDTGRHHRLAPAGW